MSDPQFDVERATAGLVLALFLAASLLVGAMYYFVLRDMEERAGASSGSQAVRVEHPSAGPPASASIPVSEHHA
ncbi:hypothetical protein GGP62_001907 [Salinibacter ruber]|uniref:Uncharacterized protein n=1 Tax=Salinibacter ruber TaxID=146919 RepID=A0A9X2TII4_9BACT|nr:hypothetical protein [Salinibacter ruber]MCS3637882.1 hypothetical protein [Salinibacter ruber]MCS3659767.1 hypothetical protein [Salinibacter ruber]MCS3706878.1 hypothetical protein [Salinibacter ruber]MCS3709394.1 hypothetical protein [Salinibacter ruber]MCS3753471.1 hypothetical protein [Salinibacter ruber]